MDVQMYVCTDVGFSSISKGKPSLSDENAMTDFHKTWYVGSGWAQVLPTWSVITKMCIFNTSFAYLF